MNGQMRSSPQYSQSANAPPARHQQRTPANKEEKQKLLDEVCGGSSLALNYVAGSIPLTTKRENLHCAMDQTLVDVTVVAFSNRCQAMLFCSNDSTALATAAVDANLCTQLKPHCVVPSLWRERD